jgi:hypothetical protein
VWGLPALAIAAGLVAAGCSTRPLIPYSAETPPLALVPATQAGVQDKRARFREIYCAVLQARGNEVPDGRPSEEALSRIDRQARRSRLVETWPDRSDRCRHRL